jgi:putative intracellular protease/amidase
MAKGAGYLIAFAVPPLVAAVLMTVNANRALLAPAQPPVLPTALQPPAHDPSKPTVAILVSNNGTEITDLLAPYEVFAATGAFSVYTVAPQRAYIPFMWGGVDLMPHYSFAELDRLLGGNPAVIVIPYIKDPENPEIVQWIRDHAGPDTQVVSICGGALVLAATGLVDHAQVTSHQNVIPILRKQYPQIQVVSGVRYTDNGNTITSAGITAGIDASLYTVQKLLGKEAALATAHKLNYPHVRFLDDPRHLPHSMVQAGLTMYANAGFVWQKSEFGVYLYDGVGEIDLTAVLDTYGRTYLARTVTFAEQQGVIRSRYGLWLLPRRDSAGLKGIDRILVPGRQGDVQDAGTLAAWTTEQASLPVEYLYRTGDAPTFAFDATLTDLAHWSSRTDARSSFTTLEYPAEELPLAGRSWPLFRLWPALLLGLSGVSLLFAAGQWRMARPKRLRLAPA